VDTITYQDIPQPDGTTVSYAFINRADGTFTSMPKSIYDAMQAASTLQSSIPQAGE